METPEYSGNIRNVAVVAKELGRIAKRNNGELTPDLVLDSAADPKSPLHSHFTWDDSEAARKCRILEAQYLIRQVKVRVEMQDREKPIMARAFVNVAPATPEGDEPRRSVYVPLASALNSTSYREQMLANAASDLRSFKHRYAILRELAEVFEAADKFAASR